DVELEEDLAQVVLHRAGADEQLRPDLGVGEPIPGESCDMCLLGREHAARVVGAAPHGLTGGLELVTSAVGEPLGADAAEQLVGGSELFTRVDAAVLPAQPFAVSEPGAREGDHAARAGEPLDSPAVERLRGLRVGYQRA